MCGRGHCIIGNNGTAGGYFFFVPMNLAVYFQSTVGSTAAQSVPYIVQLGLLKLLPFSVSNNLMKLDPRHGRGPHVDHPGRAGPRHQRSELLEDDHRASTCWACPGKTSTPSAWRSSTRRPTRATSPPRTSSRGTSCSTRRRTATRPSHSTSSASTRSSPPPRWTPTRSSPTPTCPRTPTSPTSCRSTRTSWASSPTTTRTTTRPPASRTCTAWVWSRSSGPTSCSTTCRRPTGSPPSSAIPTASPPTARPGPPAARSAAASRAS